MSTLCLAVLMTICLTTVSSSPTVLVVSSRTRPRGRCSLPPQVGPCRARLPRVFFNATSGRCERFFYGGCDGNGNNFKATADCIASCEADSAGRCSLPAVTGVCRANIPRFFFNATSAKCEKFVYGGCGGNSNNFKSDKECQIVCAASQADKCSLPPVTGPCEASVPRLFFNSTSGKCQKFVYGGCGGNKNNFKTSDQCEATCKASQADRCSLPPMAGPCLASVPRFFFNGTSGECEKFTYGGCKGNKNNFEYATDCMLACSRGYILDLFTLSSLNFPSKIDFSSPQAKKGKLV